MKRITAALAQGDTEAAAADYEFIKRTTVEDATALKEWAAERRDFYVSMARMRKL